MDKETLSNYGWIVIAVLVLVVMIALATPFGSFVSEAVQSTTKGLFDVNKNALDAAGVPGLTVQDQEFDVPDMNHGANTPVVVAGSATFNDGVTLTWDELKLAENGTKYGYDASAISDTTLGQAFNSCASITSVILPEGMVTIDNYAFAWCPIECITIPDSVTAIGEGAFGPSNLNTINFTGTQTQWDAITKGADWDNIDEDYDASNNAGLYTINYNYSK